MLSEKHLGELIMKHAYFTTDHRMHCALLSISPEDIPSEMSEEEIVEKLKTVVENYTSAEDICDDSILRFMNPFTGEQQEFYALQCCSFFGTYEGSESLKKLEKILGYDYYKK